jgi:hypothetical protein
MFQKLRVTEVYAFFMKEMYWKCAKSKHAPAWVFMNLELMVLAFLMYQRPINNG